MDGGTALVRIAGVASAETMHQLLLDNRRWLAENQGHAQLAFYDGASLALDPHALLKVAHETMIADGGLVVPTALIVHPDQVEFFESYAWLMAQKGVARAVFQSAEPAQRWAAQWARVHEAVQRSSLAGAPEGQRSRP